MDAEAFDRARLANLIHDRPLQMLAASSLRLEMLRERTSGIDDAALEISRLIASTIAELRLCVSILEPPDDGVGLGATIRRIVTDSSLAGDIPVEFNGADDVDLDARGANAAKAIVVDAMISAVHEGRGTLVIGLTKNEDAVHLTIHGLPANSADLTALLARSAARAEATGARLWSEAGAPSSSTVDIVWPLHVAVVGP